MKSTSIVAGNLVMLALLAPPAGAVEVFLNGVQITGARDQVIDKAKVVLDKNGNVHISAPDYKVREVGATSTTPTPPPAAPATSADLHNKYFVVTEIPRPRATGYQVQVMVNNKFLRTLGDDVTQYVLELNNYLKEGTNTVSFRALRPAGKAAQSTQASDYFSVVLGEGKVSADGTLTIDNVLGEFKVTAIDRGEKAQTFTITAR
ncbi:MAG: hypothetical protein DRI34_13520 [Deltaproteobacteria bacterium]|nr:MAG: hypothetical protein DRI34_13520 [Deltaproteobacteria bacterium]